MCAKTRWAARASCATTSDDWHRLLNAVLSAVACGALGLGAVGPRGAIIGAVALCLALLAHVIVTVVRGGDLYSCIAFGGDIDPASARRVPRRIGLPNRSALNEPDGAPTRTRLEFIVVPKTRASLLRYRSAIPPLPWPLSVCLTGSALLCQTPGPL